MRLSVFFIAILPVACFKTGAEEEDSLCLAEVQKKTITWQDDIFPLVEKYCKNCHGATPQAPATQNLTVKANLMAYYNPANDTNGPGLLVRLTTPTQRMPPDGGLSFCEIEKFKKWSQDGFP